MLVILSDGIFALMMLSMSIVVDIGMNVDFTMMYVGVDNNIGVDITIDIDSMDVDNIDDDFDFGRCKFW